jgi:hypothetical protein
MTLERRYLPLLTDDGRLIPRPDYMVFAAMAQPDAASMRHIYETMLLEDQLRPTSDPEDMSDFARRVLSKDINANVPGRVMAGEVILELVHLAQARRAPPTLNQARKIVARDYQNYINKKSSFSTVLRAVEKHFSHYRAVSHLLAVAAYKPRLIYDLEGEMLPLREFLGLARGFEAFIDNEVVSPGFKWDPFRIPHQFPVRPVPPLLARDLEALSQREA